jgi:uncharacterized protein (TIGR02145 family)
MTEENKNTSLIKLETGTLVRVSKQIAVTNKLLRKTSETVTDIDGNIYHTVKIGTQVWMVENLNVSHFRNGDILPEAKTDEDWQEARKNKQLAWCYYDNKPENGKIYGKLYNWYAVNDSRGLAPLGWHIPTDEEWTMLTDFLGGTSVAGGKMKEVGTSHWKSPNTSADNSSGFTALPGGSHHFTGSYNYIGNHGYWWSTTEFKFNTLDAWHRYIYSGSSVVISFNLEKVSRASVRCVMDI